MNNTSNQFKLLVQSEMARLESVIAQNQSINTYPTIMHRYEVRGRNVLNRKQSKYFNFLSFARMVQFLF